MKQCHVDVTALEFAKVLVISDQSELLEDASDLGISSTDAVAYAAYELANSFHKEQDRRRE
jgi:hypothetical protein